MGENLGIDLLGYLTRDERSELLVLRDRLMESKSELWRLKSVYEVIGVDERLFDVLGSIEDDRVRVMELRRAAERREGFVEKLTS